MKQGHGETTPLTLIRSLGHRFMLLALIMLTFGLMLIGKADTVLVERMRTTVNDAVAPILDVLSRPATGIANFIDNVHDLTALREENARLKEDNRRLLHWQATARRLVAENKSLQGLLHMVPEASASFVTARVIAEHSGPYARSLLVNAGAKDGVRKGQAVISGEGLVGRVAEVGYHAARVLLISDINSRIPVMLEGPRSRAVMAGENTSRPRLNFLSRGTEVQSGQRVVTSGSAAAFPPGIPVGLTVAAEGVVRVEPMVQPEFLEYVRIVDYGLTGILSDGDGAHLEE